MNPVFHPHFSRYLTVVACLVVLLSMSFTVLAAGKWKVPEYLPGASIITAEDLNDIRHELTNIVLIDTREAEQAKSSILGAVNIDGDYMSPADLSHLLKDKSVPVVFFGAGNTSIKSYKAAKNAINFGYVNVFWLRGGLEEWTDKGFLTTDIQQPNG